MPTKYVEETIYEMWNRIHSSLAHMEVYDYEAYDHHEAHDNIELRIEICYIFGQPIKNFG